MLAGSASPHTLHFSHALRFAHVAIQDRIGDVLDGELSDDSDAGKQTGDGRGGKVEMLALQRKLNKQVAMTVEWKQKHDVLHSHPTGAPRIRELEEQLHDKDVELVAAGNKNFQLHDASVKAKDTCN